MSHCTTRSLIESLRRHLSRLLTLHLRQQSRATTLDKLQGLSAPNQVLRPRLSIDLLAVEFARVVLDEVEAMLGIAAHQLVDQFLHRRALLELGW